MYYKGCIKGWDVLNEVIELDGFWCKFFFYEILGEEYILFIFQYVYEVDLEVEFYYNDYGMDGKVKCDKVVELVKMLKDCGLCIDVVGMQGYMGMDYLLVFEFEVSILVFVVIGVKVMVIEWDMSVLFMVWMGVNILDMVFYK